MADFLKAHIHTQHWETQYWIFSRVRPVQEGIHSSIHPSTLTHFSHTERRHVEKNEKKNCISSLTYVSFALIQSAYNIKNSNSNKKKNNKTKVAIVVCLVIFQFKLWIRMTLSHFVDQLFTTAQCFFTVVHISFARVLCVRVCVCIGVSMYYEAIIWTWTSNPKFCHQSQFTTQSQIIRDIHSFAYSNNHVKSVLLTQWWMCVYRMRIAQWSVGFFTHKFTKVYRKSEAGFDTFQYARCCCFDFHSKSSLYLLWAGELPPPWQTIDTPWNCDTIS